MSWFLAAAAALNYAANRSANRKAANQAVANNALQTDLAKNGVRYRVEDAKRAGIHPLAALGMQAPSISPSSAAFVPNTALGDALNSMGQDMSRSAYATRSSSERFQQMQQARANALQLKNQELQNQYLAAQIRRLESTPSPAFPDVQSESAPVPAGLIKPIPPEVKSSMVGLPSVEAGERPGMVKYKVGGTTLTLPAGDNMADSLEGVLNPVGAAATGIQGTYEAWQKFTTGGKPPPPVRGGEWKWSILEQRWYLTSKGQRRRFDSRPGEGDFGPSP